MKKTLLIAFSAAFLASPLLACGMDDHSKADLKASASPAVKAKVAKAKTKAAKPLAVAATSEKKI